MSRQTLCSLVNKRLRKLAELYSWQRVLPPTRAFQEVSTCYPSSLSESARKLRPLHLYLLPMVHARARETDANGNDALVCHRSRSRVSVVTLLLPDFLAIRVTFVSVCRIK